ncbi:MAG: deoxyguanosinetriphosphate triphosphohydrolase [Fimbriimonadaceae bacterium]|nr:MAG: deoxyguanosinetriphosphate triphosphohydrolase [Fimbriimonadaceae bacterium]
MTIREETEAWEEKTLSPRAMLAKNSAGRLRSEELDPVRTCFQRDRDRILHSKPFRRLKHKTQVFIEPVGDHYRTRLTHSLEVAQVARTIGRALRLNEDLIEAIALGHDVGHPPFGHAGEQAIDETLKECFSGTEGAPTEFRHYDHSMRIVDVLADMNLTHEVRAGIGGHSKGRKDLSAADGLVTSTLEAAVVRISDRIAYLNHDLDDALRSGVITEIPSRFLGIGKTHGKRISAMVQDAINCSRDQDAITLSPQMLSIMNDLKEWLFENVYLVEPHPMDQVRKAKRIIRELLIHYAVPGNLPEGFVGIQGAVDYVAGMTDRFAIKTYQDLFIPTEFSDFVANVR